MAIQANHILTVAAVCAATCILSSCQNELEIGAWPTHANSVVQEFVDHREDLNAISDLMEKMRYSGVTRIGGDRVYGIRTLNGETASEVPANEDLWVWLMEGAKIDSVHRVNGTLIINKTDLESSDDRIVQIQYFYSDGYPAKMCEREHGNVACGTCDVSRQDKWAIRYTWVSGQHIEDHLKARADRSEEWLKLALEEQHAQADVSVGDFDQSFEKLDELNQACIEKGLEEMGYDNPEQ